MRRQLSKLRFLAVVLLLGFFACAVRESGDGPGLSIAGAGTPPPAATLVLKGGVVRTMDPARPRAEAVAVAGANIVFVGDAAEVDRYIGPATRVIDLAGRTVLPAFQDSHIHLATGGVVAPGRLADLIVLDRDLFAVPAAGIHAIRVLLTLFEGRPVGTPSLAGAGML